MHRKIILSNGISIDSSSLSILEFFFTKIPMALDFNPLTMMILN
jgi:hypothetical protein